MLASSFEVALGAQVIPGMCCVGKYNGKSPHFTAAISGGKVLVHSSQEQDKKTGKNAIRTLNLNKQVTAINCGTIDPLRNKVDILLVGTKTNLLAYDVEFNSDIFYRDVPDGVSAMAVGTLEGRRYPSVIVGGNCAIQGFDVDGEEVYWSVTGDNVSALAFADVDGDGQSELLVGSDDFEIKIYQNEEVISQTSETDRVSHLTPMYVRLLLLVHCCCCCRCGCNRCNSCNFCNCYCHPLPQLSPSPPPYTISVRRAAAHRKSLCVQ
jgi:Bardet-Biedl syndrome 2 protein